MSAQRSRLDVIMDIIFVTLMSCMASGCMFMLASEFSMTPDMDALRVQRALLPAPCSCYHLDRSWRARLVRFFLSLFTRK